jgi:hypothetical protein
MIFMRRTRYPFGNKIIFLLSVKVGLRAMKIAYLRWRNILNADGLLSGVIIIEDAGSKGKRGGRSIPVHPKRRLIDML